MQRVSIKDLLISAGLFVWNNPRAILSRAIVPLVGGGIVLYLSLSAYLSELDKLLRTRNEHVAGLVLAAATAGFLVFLMFHSIMRISLAALALERETYTPWLHLQFSRREWRLYAANLRGLLLSVPFVVLVELCSGLLGRLFPQLALLCASLSILVVLLGFITIEAGIYMVAPAVTLQEKGQILRRSWRLSRSAFLKIALVCVLLFVPGLILENLCELALKLSGQVQLNPSVPTMTSAVVDFQEILPELLMALAIPYLVTISLLTGAGMRAYKVLTGTASA